MVVRCRGYRIRVMWIEGHLVPLEYYTPVGPAENIIRSSGEPPRQNFCLV